MSSKGGVTVIIVSSKTTRFAVKRLLSFFTSPISIKNAMEYFCDAYIGEKVFIDGLKCYLVGKMGTKGGVTFIKYFSKTSRFATK